MVCHFPDCTDGFWVNKAGYGNYMLTAAHCGSIAQTWCHPYQADGTCADGIDYVGYTGALDGPSDGALFTGSYQTRIWLGTINTTVWRNVNYRVVSEYVGQPICTGGAKSGQYCDVVITDLSQTNWNGYDYAVEACSLNTANDPVNPGDSGGPVYHMSSSSNLYIHGMISAEYPAPSANCMLYVPMYRLESRLGVTLKTYGAQ